MEQGDKITKLNFFKQDKIGNLIMSNNHKVGELSTIKSI